MKMEQNIPGIRIRMAVPADAPSIASVLHESFIEYESLYTQEGFAATTPASDQIQNRIEECPVWVALQGDVIVGTVSVVPEGEALYVRGMAILPAARGQRIGGLLLRQIEGFATEHGFQHLFLSTTPFLNHAIQLYERYGFKRSSEGPDNLFGTPLFTMEKILEPPD
jgi:ribosomal protein S18 acetylase RimI-like enzyme